MKYFGKMIKSFVMTPQLILTYLLLIIAGNVTMIKLFSAFLNEFRTVGELSTDAIFYYADMRELCIVMFICWFFISFEAGKKITSIKEIFDAMGRRSAVPYISQILVLWMGILLYTINISGYAVAGYVALQYSSAVIEEAIKFVLVDVFLLSVASAGMGLLVSGIKKKIVGYFIFITLTFYMIPDYYEVIREMIPVGQEIMQGIRGMMCFLPTDLVSTPDALYGMAFDTYRIMSMLLWTVLGIFSFVRTCFVESKRGKIIVSGVYSALVFAFFAGAWNQGSVLRMEDELYYISQYYAEHEQKEKTVNYNIKNYEINFEINNKLQAECRLNLQGEINQKEYLFTLYHGYKINDIRDDSGKKMRFERCGDYVTVYADTPTSYVDMSYYGSGGIFYSNYNACFLPGFFSYYPRSGFVKVFDEEKRIFKAGKEETATFNVGIKGKGNYFVNIPEKSENSGKYEGNTDGLTIVMGKYEVINGDGCNYYVLPLQKSSYYLIENYKNKIFQGKELKQLEELLGEDLSQNLRNKENVFVIPDSLAFNSLMTNFYNTDSDVFLSFQGDVYSIPESITGKGSYESLKNIFYELRVTEDSELSDMVFHKEFVEPQMYTKRDELYDAVLEKMRSCGAKKIVKKIWKYISSENYVENLDEELVFVQSI